MAMPMVRQKWYRAFLRPILVKHVHDRTTLRVAAALMSDKPASWRDHVASAELAWLTPIRAKQVPQKNARVLSVCYTMVRCSKRHGVSNSSNY
jgi:hypothetical protein